MMCSKEAEELKKLMLEDGWVDVRIARFVSAGFRVYATDPLSGEEHFFIDEYDYDDYKKA